MRRVAIRSPAPIRCPARGGHDPGVVDPAVGDQPVPDRGVELGDLLAGVRHHGDVGCPVVVGGGRGQRVLQRCGSGCRRIRPRARRASNTAPGLSPRRIARVSSAYSRSGTVWPVPSVRVKRCTDSRVRWAAGSTWRGGEVEDAAAADRGELVAVTEQRDPRLGTRRRR